MKDDHLQGILFSRSPQVEFGSASASQRVVRRAKSLAGRLSLPTRESFKSFLPRRDTELGNFIDQNELGELISRFRR